MSDLSSLKNIGNTSAFWLKTIGINNYDELQAAGPVMAYIRIQEYGIKTTKSLLYALYGALQDIHWKEIDEQTKLKLCKEADVEINKRNNLVSS